MTEANDAAQTNPGSEAATTTRRGELWRTLEIGNRTLAIHLERGTDKFPPSANLYVEMPRGRSDRAWRFVISLRPGRVIALADALREAGTELERLAEGSPAPRTAGQARRNPGVPPSSFLAIQGAGKPEGT